MENLGLLHLLLEADTEAQVIEILRDAGHWDDPAVWRPYGDVDANYGSAGNQQGNPEAALVEKVVNSIDALLMLECQLRGIEPAGANAPRSVREAVARFYEGAEPGAVRGYQGLLSEWPEARVRELSGNATISLTGDRGPDNFPSVTVADRGEGQSPDRLPETILSLQQGIKEKIPFVQGKWNMGGTGALRFAGERNLQLVLSKRHPTLAASEGLSPHWGFSIVRRDDPGEGRFVSTLRYLAPVGAAVTPRGGGVLTVESASLPIFPEKQRPYAKEAEWGTLVKLYEYRTKYRSMMFRRDGLLSRLDILLPDIGLPVRLHECRQFSGQEERSFETTLKGLMDRLSSSKNLEPGFPDGGFIDISGGLVKFHIYAFKRDFEKTYKRDEGLIFVVNGQTHAIEGDRFFLRKSVGMGSIRKSILVIIDCDDLGYRNRERLFMNSRDRLADEALANSILDEIGVTIGRHSGLKALRERRRREEVEQRLADSKPVEDILQRMFRRSPRLASLFLPGTRLSNPFATSPAPVETAFAGKDHPSYFRFRSLRDGEPLIRDCHLGRRIRLDFETDVGNDYFIRRVNAGQLSLDASLNGSSVQAVHRVNLRDGLAHLNVELPGSARVGDELCVLVSVADPTLVEPFVNQARLTVRPEQSQAPSRPGKTSSNPPRGEGPQQKETPLGIALPDIIPVWRDDWEKYGMDEYSALKVDRVDETSTGSPVFQFKVNVDNLHLLSELKASKQDPRLLRSKWQIGLALMGLAIAQRWPDAQKRLSLDAGVELAPEEVVEAAAEGMAPMVLPLLDALGALTGDEFDSEEEP